MKYDIKNREIISCGNGKNLNKFTAMKRTNIGIIELNFGPNSIIL